jgi:hypothetical protein
VPRVPAERTVKTENSRERSKNLPALFSTVKKIFGGLPTNGKIDRRASGLTG